MSSELFDWNVWAAPVFVLSFALLLGIIMALRSWSSGEGSSGQALRQADHEALLARKDALLERIRELDAERGKLAEAERLRRRELLLAEAAEVLKALDEVESGGVLGETEGAEAEGGLAGSSVPAPKPSSRGGLLTGVVFVVVFAVIGLMLGQYTAERAPGQSMTGNTSESELQAAIDEAQATLEQDPDHLASLNLLTYIAILQRDANNAMALVDRARAVDPDNAEVLLHLGVLRLMVGMSDQALVSIMEARAADPELGRALLWEGMARLSLDQREEAASVLTEALGRELMPIEQQIATQLLAEAKAPPAQDRLLGTVAVAEGLPAPTGGVLYLIARRTAEGGGPPVASQKLPGAALQGVQDFVISDNDVMLGGAWPEEVWLSARLDSDGDPLTKELTDLVAEQVGPLASGSAGIELVLQAQDGAPEAAEGAAPVEGEGDAKDAAAAARVTGSLELAAGTELPEGGVLFLIAQRSEQGGGPPVAVTRQEGAGLSLPLTFSLSDGDMMMPGEWPAEVWVKARLDTDGNAMTRGEGDLETAVVGPLTSGATGARLVLGGS